MSNDTNNSTKNHGSIHAEIARAIARSKSHNEIVTIDSSSGDAGALCDALSAECEGEALNKAFFVHEFWGQDVEENEWRVHVRLPNDLEA